jgi:hypothetical protein
MNAPDSLSRTARRLMWAATAAFAAVGLVLFVAPGWSADHFPWRISPMVAMTMGGWYLGSAAMSALVAHHGRWSIMRAPALYVGLFAGAEIVVLALNSGRLRTDQALAWPYVGMLAVALLAGLAALYDAVRRRPTLADEGNPVTRLVRVIGVLFMVFVGFLAIVALSGSSAGLYGAIFPEPLSLLTLQAFGAFYASLSLSMLSLVRARRLRPITTHVQGGLVLIVLITLAALANFSSFNLSYYPRQSFYLIAYLLALALAVAHLLAERRRAPRAPSAAEGPEGTIAGGV